MLLRISTSLLHGCSGQCLRMSAQEAKLAHDHTLFSGATNCLLWKTTEGNKHLTFVSGWHAKKNKALCCRNVFKVGVIGELKGNFFFEDEHFSA